jgi:hypothetical protein
VHHIAPVQVRHAVSNLTQPEQQLQLRHTMHDDSSSSGGSTSARGSGATMELALLELDALLVLCFDWLCPRMPHGPDLTATRLSCRSGRLRMRNTRCCGAARCCTHALAALSHLSSSAHLPQALHCIASALCYATAHTALLQCHGCSPISLEASIHRMSPLQLSASPLHGLPAAAALPKVPSSTR